MSTGEARFLALAAWRGSAAVGTRLNGHDSPRAINQPANQTKNSSKRAVPQHRLRSAKPSSALPFPTGRPSPALPSGHERKTSNLIYANTARIIGGIPGTDLSITLGTSYCMGRILRKKQSLVLLFGSSMRLSRG